MSEVINKPSSDDDEINLIDLLIAIAQHKKFLILAPLIVGGIAAVYSLIMPNVYTASVKLMPPQSSGSSAAAMLSQIGGSAIGGLAGGALGLKNPGDLYVGLLKSRTVSDRIILRFNLKKRFSAKTMESARIGLGMRVTAALGKEGLISLEFDDKDPEFAAAVANAYVDELGALLQRLAVTEAGQRRLYFEKQLKRTKEELADAEAGLRHTQEKTGLIEPGTQGKVIIEAIATIRAQIASREVALGAMKSFATENNPEAIRARKEIEELRGQLKGLEKPVAAEDRHGGIVVSSEKIPEAGLEYARMLREVKYHEVLFELMAKQYEMARADEARDSGTLQVVDKAVPPDQKSKPKRSLIVLVSTVLSFALFLVFFVVKEIGRKVFLAPENVIRLKRLKSALSFRCF